MKIAKTFTGNDIRRLLEKADDFYNVSQTYEIQMQRYETDTEQVYPCVYWHGASLGGEYCEEGWWFMQEDGTWFRPWHEEEEEE